MFKAFEFCLPTNATKVPAGPEWLHEIKQDGFRFRVERDGDRVRLLTRNGHDWSKRYPWIVESALKNRTRQFVIDGEAVVLGVDGLSDFDALYSRQAVNHRKQYDHPIKFIAKKVTACERPFDLLRL